MLNPKVPVKATKLAKAWEGCRLTAYLDSVGKPTLGWGQTAGIKLGMTWTQQQADDNLDKELQNYADAIRPHLRPDTTEDEYAAFIVFAWNVGITGASGSMAVKAHNARNPDGVLASLLSWTTVTIAGKKVRNYPGLVRRRRAEWTLYSSGKVTAP